MSISNCIEQSTHGNVSVYESGCKLIIENSNKVEFKKVKVDGCININGKRCDYAIIIEAKLENILIELKGSRFRDAVQQLSNTYQWFRQNYDISPTRCIVVMTNRCPSSSGRIQILKESFKKQTGIIIKIIRSGNKIQI